MYAIVGAMPEEVSAVKNLMRECVDGKIGPVDYTLGQLNQREVVLYNSGVGLSMAAMSTGIVCSQFQLEGILNIGTAGGLDADLNVLDQVISTQITYHDFDITPFGNTRDFSVNNRYVFHSDPKLVDIAKNLCSDQVKIGAMVSGNQFISTDAQVLDITTHFPEAICVEMEAAAIAHVASQFKIPFIVLRSISDLVLHPKNEMSFEAYLLQASARSAELCYQFLGRV